MPLAAVEQNLVLLEQGIELLTGVSDETYSTPVGSGSVGIAVGPHFRHTIDVYRCFLDGFDRGEIDYDARERRGDIETKRGAAQAAFAEILEDLKAKVGGADGDRSVLVRLEPGSGGDPQEQNPERSRSTVHRELQFLVSHTVHHYALIALGLRLAGHSVPDDFGVAPSTLIHRRREQTCAG